MAKTAIVVVSLAVLFGTTHLYAQQSSECKGEIARAEGAMIAVDNEKEKQELIKEVEKAKDALAKNSEATCMAYMETVRSRMLKVRRAQE